MYEGKDTCQVNKGDKIKDILPEIAKLRIEVFREYPFLYEVDYDHEMRYLKQFHKMQDAIVVTALDRDKVVGISTGYPFLDEMDALQASVCQRKPQA